MMTATHIHACFTPSDFMTSMPYRDMECGDIRAYVKFRLIAAGMNLAATISAERHAEMLIFSQKLEDAVGA